MTADMISGSGSRPHPAGDHRPRRRCPGHGHPGARAAVRKIDPCRGSRAGILRASSAEWISLCPVVVTTDLSSERPASMSATPHGLPKCWSTIPPDRGHEFGADLRELWLLAEPLAQRLWGGAGMPRWPIALPNLHDLLVAHRVWSEERSWAPPAKLARPLRSARVSPAEFDRYVIAAETLCLRWGAACLVGRAGDLADARVERSLRARPPFASQHG